jgi:hypothetical protein
MEGYIQMKDTRRKLRSTDKREYQLKQIIKALAWWSDGGWEKASHAVGALIQREAQKLTGITADMSSLKFEAEGILKRLKNEEAREKNLQEELARSQQSIMPGRAMYPFTSYPFPTLTVTKQTRRDELEAMDNRKIEAIYYKAEAKELKKGMIDYILESEKEYK